MGVDYLMFHCTYTIPLAGILTIAYGPFFTRRDFYRICTLSIIAVVATIPWDSYLIRNKIWSYPPTAVVGLTIYSIPLEEVFFFIIQTYITTVLYCIVCKPLVLPAYLRISSRASQIRDLGQAALLSLFLTGIGCLQSSKNVTYLGLILIWASPVLMLQWSVSYTFITNLPWKVLLFPICLPTLFLWIADANAISAGYWAIEPGTKLDYQLWRGLEIEEATFFFLTNVMLVGGLVSFDYVLVLEEYQILVSKKPPHTKVSLRSALASFINQPRRCNTDTVSQLSQALTRLQASSQSMFIGSALFQGNLRIDLILLYSFCRVMDNLVDNPGETHSARYWIDCCLNELNIRCNNLTQPRKAPLCLESDKLNDLRSTISLLPLQRLPKEALFDLMKGFETDLLFNLQEGQSPIRTEADLDLYAYRVAGTIATLLLELVYHYHYHNVPIYPPNHLIDLTRAGADMGKALQCVNIARDIVRDAAIQRVYIPASWLAEIGLTPAELIECPTSPKAHLMQQKMLAHADHYYQRSVASIDQLPDGVRQPIRATVESYMEIAAALRKRQGGWLRREKLSLPLWRRLLVVWLAMSS